MTRTVRLLIRLRLTPEMFSASSIFTHSRSLKETNNYDTKKQGYQASMQLAQSTSRINKIYCAPLTRYCRTRISVRQTRRSDVACGRCATTEEQRNCTKQEAACRRFVCSFCLRNCFFWVLYSRLYSCRNF